MSISKIPAKKSPKGYVYRCEIFYKESGKQKRHTKSGFITKKEALEYEKKKRKELNKELSFSTLNFNELSARYFKYIQSIHKFSENTINKEIRLWNSYAKESIGLVYINNINPMIISDYFYSLTCSLNTQYEIKLMFSHIIDFAQSYSDNTLDQKLLINIEIKKKQSENLYQYDSRIISDEDYNAVIKYISEINHQKIDINVLNSFKIVLMIQKYTGLECSRILCLKLKDIDLENSTININKYINYHDSSKQNVKIKKLSGCFSFNGPIKINKELNLILKEWIDYIKPKDLLFFDKNGNYIIPSMLQHIMKKYKATVDVLKRNEFFYENMCLYLDDIFNFYTYFDKNTESSYIIAIVIAHYTGLRLAEIFALKKTDFDFEKNKIYIQRQLIYNDQKKKNIHTVDNLKTNSSRSFVPLPEALKEKLIKRFKENNYEWVICDDQGNLLNPKNLQRHLKKINLNCDLNISMHNFRHTLASKLIANNIPVKITQMILRHTNYNTTLNVYTHITKQQTKESIDNLFNNAVS